MSSSDGTATPRAAEHETQNETENVRDVIHSITQSLGELEASFGNLNARSGQLATMGLRPEDAAREMETLRREIREQRKKEEKEIDGLKRMAREDVKRQIAEHLRNDILEQVRVEITAQVKEQVDRQIEEHIPVSLRQQSIDNKVQLQDAKTSLINSAARKKNSSSRIQNLDESLAVVLKADGTKGRLFPADLRSLLSYDAAAICELVADYGLVVDEVREVNVNRFIAHLGILFQLVVL